MSTVNAGGGEDSPPVSPVSAGGCRGQFAAEVETELEDNGAYDEDEVNCQDATLLAPDEVEEELSRPPSPSVGATPSAPSRSSDYAMPDENKEVWKKFGCDTEAGRMLRRLYKVPGVKDAASKVAYPRLPSPSQRWDPEAAAAAQKPCAKKVVVKVPRPAAPRRDPDDPRNWPALPVPCRKPAREILAEMEADQARARRAGPPANLPKGRDQAVEKESLQDRFRYCGGRAMPPGAMGYVQAGELPPKAPEKEDRKRIDADGFNAEHREIFEELLLAVRRKQARIAEIDDEEKKDPRPSKAKTARNKEALELRNAIDRDLKDVDKLLELTEASR